MTLQLSMTEPANTQLKSFVDDSANMQCTTIEPLRYAVCLYSTDAVDGSFFETILQNSVKYQADRLCQIQYIIIQHRARQYISEQEKKIYIPRKKSRIIKDLLY